jgi:prepilin signal peptidase PulO-like enzyme (type II secretory pathway)
MYKPFFPNPAFAWAFCAALVALLAVAAYADFRSMKIPKAVTIPLFALGVLAGVARGAWLATQ